MAIYKIGQNIEHVKEKPFKLEKEIQSLTDIDYYLSLLKQSLRINKDRK